MWRLAVPIMIGIGIQTLYTLIDMIYIGRLGGDAIASVAFNMPIFFFVMGLSLVLEMVLLHLLQDLLAQMIKLNADNSAEHALQWDL